MKDKLLLAVLWSCATCLDTHEVLSALHVRGGELCPAFSPSRFSYEVELDDETVEELTAKVFEGRSADDNFAIEIHPQLDASSFRDSGQSPPRLFVRGKEVRYEEDIPTVRVDLGSFFPTVLDEGHFSDGPGHTAVDLQFRGEHSGSRQTYVIRVLNPIFMASQLLRDKDQVEGDRTRRLSASSVSQTGGFAVAAPRENKHDIALRLADGSCFTTSGFFHKSQSISSSMKELGLWGESTDHILCFKPAGKDGRFKVVAHRIPRPSDGGSFGFGSGVEVGLRPELATEAVWPLQEGVSSLSLSLNGGFRALAVRVKSAEGSHDTPVVVMEAQNDVPVGVQLLNTSMGACTWSPTAFVNRFICRTLPTAAGDFAEMVAFCPMCASDSLPRSISVRMFQNNTDVATTAWSETGEQKLWLGWTTSVPGENEVLRWRVYSGRTTDKRRLSDTTAVEVVLVSGQTEVLTQEDIFLRNVLASAGSSLLHAAELVAVSALGVLILLTILGLPRRLYAILPTFSSALFVLQVLALVGNGDNASPIVRALSGPLSPLSPEPTLMLLVFFIVMAAVMFFHACAVCFHIVVNGAGSAEFLPHGLKLGAWELRVVGLCAFPLAAASTDLLASGVAQPSLGTVCLGLAGAVVLVAFLGGAISVYRQVSRALADERVIRVALPFAPGSPPLTAQERKSRAIFVDRTCDQLRALPTNGAGNRLFDTWLTSPSWYGASVVAAIQEVEHRGGRIGGERDNATDWTMDWSQGPWHKRRILTAEDSEEDRPNKLLPREQSANESVHSVSTPIPPTEKFSNSVAAAHPIRTRTTFSYAGSREHATGVAGVQFLPWMDCAVPAYYLPTIEAHLGSVALQVHVGQLSGPIVDGRLGVCFDWGTNWPGRWASDLVLKILMGVCASLSIHSCAGTSYAELVMTFGTVLVSGYGIMLMFLRPYVHLFDNIVCLSSLFAVACCTALGASGVEDLYQTLFAAGMVLIASSLPVFAAVAGTVTLLTAIFARPPSGDEAIASWTSSSRASTKSEPAAQVDIVLKDMQKMPRFPGLVRMPLRHAQMRPHERWGRVHTEMVTGQEKPWLPLAPELVFPVPGLRRVATTDSVPMAILVRPPDESRLIFVDDAQNGGMDWSRSVRCFFGIDSTAESDEAEQLIKQHTLPTAGGAVARVFLIIESLGASSAHYRPVTPS